MATSFITCMNRVPLIKSPEVRRRFIGGERTRGDSVPLPERRAPVDTNFVEVEMLLEDQIYGDCLQVTCSQTSE